MDSRERVEAALQLQRPDRVPVGAWGHSYLDEWNAQRLADVTVGRARRYRWDFVKFQPRASSFAEAFGAEYRPSGSTTDGPVQVGQVVNAVGDWGRVAGDGIRAGVFAQQVDSIGIVATTLGDRVPVIQTVFSPLTVAGYLVGGDSRVVVEQLREAPEVVGPALARIGEALVDFTRSSVAAGAAGVFYAVSGYASRDTMSRDEYEATVLPYDIAVLSRLPEQAWFNVLHLCGPRQHFEIARLLPVQAVSYSIHNEGNPDLKQARAMVDMAVMGGLGHRSTLLSGSPEDVRHEADRAISLTDGRGLLLAPGCSVPPEASEDNMSALAMAGVPA